jgi:hypothetical protein
VLDTPDVQVAQSTTEVSISYCDAARLKSTSAFGEATARSAVSPIDRCEVIVDGRSMHERIGGFLCLTTSIAACSSEISTNGSGGTATTTSSVGSSSSSGPGGGSGCDRATDPPCPLWSKRFGDESNEDLVAMAGDAGGSLYLLGTSPDPSTFGGGPLTSASRAVFVAKLDAAGNHVWSKALRSVGDTNANLAIAGDLSGPVDFGSGSVAPPDPGTSVRPLRVAANTAGAPIVVGQYFGAPDLGGGALPSFDGPFLAGLSQL